jgi:hypothetical protein
MKHFTFSPSVLSIINRAMPLLAPAYENYDLSAALDAPPTPHVYGNLKHILAIHLRRGTGWVEACEDKARDIAYVDCDPQICYR